MRLVTDFPRFVRRRPTVWWVLSVGGTVVSITYYRSSLAHQHLDAGLAILCAAPSSHWCSASSFTIYILATKNGNSNPPSQGWRCAATWAWNASRCHHDIDEGGDAKIFDLDQTRRRGPMAWSRWRSRCIELSVISVLRRSLRGVLDGRKAHSVLTRRSPVGCRSWTVASCQLPSGGQRRQM